ncbi:MAG: hypothetical protein KJ950_14285 [Proteobacteria bacterium]|nr:hypothetical protein [Pseudomonadota bacterium]MBU1685935.1 hypothetical protein [Pseudomonadota bacterium]
MNRILMRYFGRFQGRSLLIVIALLLLLLNVGRWMLASYQAGQADVEGKQARISQYRKTIALGDGLKTRLNDLLVRRKQVEHYFFRGPSEENVASIMQIEIQGLVTRSGLESESIRPMMQSSDRNREGVADEDLLEITIKMRLTGTMDQFLGFIDLLYGSSKFFLVESLNLKPYKKAGLKIALDLKGYYLLTQSGKAIVADKATGEKP